jgi:thiamine biosynthesis protein ThiS
MIRVNDEPADYHPGMTVADVLRVFGYAAATVAVWVDDQIVPRGDFDTNVLPDEADIRIVLMAAGG